MKYVIIHGTMGSPDINWFPWLKEKMESQGHEVYVPKMPTPEGQDKENWYKTLISEVPEIDGDTVLIGHSIGPTFLFYVLEQLENSVHKSIFVSSVMGTIDKEFDEYNVLNKSFIEHDFDWDKIKKNAGEITIFHGDNDPYVPLKEHGEVLSMKLDVPVTVLNRAGHINGEFGFDKFEEILEVI